MKSQKQGKKGTLYRINQYVLISGILGLATFGVISLAHTELPSQIKELAGYILVDSRVEVTQSLQVNKYLDLVDASTPTVKASHVQIWVNKTGTKQYLKVQFEDGTVSTLSNN